MTSFAAPARLSSSQKRDEFPEHLGDVGAVDLVDDEDVSLPFAGFAGALRDALQYAVGRDEAKAGAAFVRLGAQALDEFLIAVGLMKGDEFDTAFFDQRVVAAADVLV